MKVRSLYIDKNRNILYLLDQRLLPHRIKYLPCFNAKQTAHAIKNMVVRGAPAIGAAAAYGYYLDAWNFLKKISAGRKDIIKKFTEILLEKTPAILIAARPTAVNLAWAVNRMENVVKKNLETSPTLTPDESFIIIKKITRQLLEEAQKIFREDIMMNKKIGSHGASLLHKSSSILTHCNAGALATAGYGTALGVIRSAYSHGKIKLVYVDETRPYLQGARLTAWELSSEKIPYRIITDNMAGYFMSTGKIDAIVVGADRIASNGDTANKIGTYSLAVLAHYHKIPFYVAAPSSTIDLSIKNGSGIKIEERSSDEVLYINGKRIAPPAAVAIHPAFDVTPASLITAIITEKGVYRPKKPFHFTSKDLSYNFNRL